MFEAIKSALFAVVEAVFAIFKTIGGGIVDLIFSAADAVWADGDMSGLEDLFDTLDYLLPVTEGFGMLGAYLGIWGTALAVSWVVRIVRGA